MAQDPVLASFRQSIDNIDAALIFMLAERFKITKAVGEYKARTDLPPADPGREEEQIARMKRLAVDADLDPDFSVRKNLLIFARYFDLEPNATARRADDLLEKMGLTEKADSVIPELSGGMKRRLMLR